jgi:hypothetical protein
MKNLFFLLVLAGLTQVSYGQQAPATTPKADVAVIQWDNQNFDFGKIKQGVPASHEFKFTNKGKVPLVITNAQPSCGCTTPDWTRTPVAPGAQGFIKATYNAAASGPFTKSITVTANIEGGSNILTIKGEVGAPAAATTPAATGTPAK